MQESIVMTVKELKIIC